MPDEAEEPRVPFAKQPVHLRAFTPPPLGGDPDWDHNKDGPAIPENSKWVSRMADRGVIGSPKYPGNDEEGEN